MIGPFTNLESDLFDRFSRLRREMDDLFYSPGIPASIRAVARGSYPPVNVGATDSSVEIFVFAAGLNPDKIDLSIQKDLLTISATCQPIELEGTNSYLRERFYGEFRRVLTLPEDVDPDSVSASYKNGVLQISLKRKEAVRPRQIKVN